MRIITIKLPKFLSIFIRRFLKRQNKKAVE